MEKRKFLDESRQLKRLNALTRRQSHVYKWFAIVAALDCLLVSFYDQDMRNILFSGAFCAVSTYLYLRDRARARRYRREWDEKFGPKP